MRDGPDSPNKPDWLRDAGTGPADLDLDDDRPLPTARGVLTAAEIEALLRPKPEQARLDTPPPEPQSLEPRPAPAFDAPDEIKDAKPDARASILASRLSLALSKGSGIKAAVSVSETAHVPRKDLPVLMQDKSCAVACIGPAENDIRALICLPPLLADAIIARACGARGSTGRLGDGWTLSAIDCALLEQLLAPFGEAVGASMSLQSIETDTPYVCSLLPMNEVSVFEFDLEGQGLHTNLAVIQADLTEDSAAEALAVPTSAPVTALVTARLASLTVPLSRITELKAGSTLLLGLPGDQPVELLSGGRDGEAAYEGQMGRKSNKMAIRISKRKRSFARG
ncbi:MAG: FliM/FliN family flagellar motor switch protein [Pseudomonadota bacterium]